MPEALSPSDINFIIEKSEDLSINRSRSNRSDSSTLLRLGGDQWKQRVSSGYAPMLITTDYRRSQQANPKQIYNPGQVKKDAPNEILFWAGPKDVTWNFSQRGSVQQTRNGHIHHFWRDSVRDTYFDNPYIDFTFQTGNILPIRSYSYEDTSTVSIPNGLLDYYDFFSILDESKILSDGRPNYVVIVYETLLYPHIVLRGFFEPETVIAVREDSTKPASVQWNARFRIKSSTPNFYNSEDLIKSWTDSVDSATQALRAALYDERIKEKNEDQIRLNLINLSAQQAKEDEIALLKAEDDARELEAEKKINKKYIDFAVEVNPDNIADFTQSDVKSPSYVKKLYNDELKTNANS